MRAGTLVVDIAANVARLQADMAQAKGVVAGAMNDITRTANTAKTALAGLGVGLSAGALAYLARDIIKATAALDDMAEITGSAVEELSKLQVVAKIGGHDFGLVEDSLVRLTKGLKGTDEETKNARNALSQLGIAAKTASGQQRDAGEIMREVALKFATFQDGAAKTAFALDIFGKSGAKLLPFLKDMAEEGAVAARVTAEQARQAEQLEKNLNRLKVAAEDSKREFLMGLTPALVNFTEEIKAAQTAGFGLVGALAQVAAFRLSGKSATEAIADVDAEIARRREGNETMGRLRGYGAAIARNTSEMQNLEARRGFLLSARGLEIGRELQGQHFAEDVQPLPRGKRTPPPETGGAKGKTLADLLNEGAGVSKDFYEDLAKLHSGYKDGRITLEQYQETVARLIEKQSFARDLARQQEAAMKNELAAVEANLAAVEQFGAGKAELVRGYAEELQALAQERDLVFASTAEREKAVAFRKIELEAQRAQIGQTAAEILKIDELAEAQKRAVGVLIDEREARAGSKKAAEAAAQEWENVSRDIERALADSLMRGGKSALDYITDIFRTAVLQPILRPFAQGVTGMVQGVIGGGGGGGAGGFNPLSMFSSGSNPLSSIGSFFGGGSAISGAALTGEIAALTGSGTAAGAGLGAAGGLGAAMPWLGAGLLAANALGLFGDDGDKRKPSQLGLKKEMGRFWFHQVDVPGGEGNLPLYNSIERDLNDPTKYDPGTLEGLLGMIEGAQGESAESLVQKLLQRAAPAAGMATARTGAREALLAAQDPRGYWGGKVSSLGEELGTSATTTGSWRTEFLAALNGEISSSQLENWQKLGEAIERASQAAGAAAGSISARGFRTRAEYQYAQRTGDSSGSVEAQAIAMTNAKLLRIFERWDGEGMPAERVV